jgi:hypothetical protein
MIPYRKFSDIQSDELGAPAAPNPPKAPKICDEGLNNARTLDGLGALAASCSELENEAVTPYIVTEDGAGKNQRAPEYGAKAAKAAKDQLNSFLSEASGALQTCATGNRATWSAEDWRAHFDERAGFLEHDGGLSRVDAEVQAFERCTIEWLNANPSSSPAGCCAWCSKPETPSAMVLPFGTGEHHAWLHAECWAAWHQRRREEAVLALSEMGVPIGGDYDD